MGSTPKRELRELYILTQIDIKLFLIGNYKLMEQKKVKQKSKTLLVVF